MRWPFVHAFDAAILMGKPASPIGKRAQGHLRVDYLVSLDLVQMRPFSPSLPAYNLLYPVIVLLSPIFFQLGYLFVKFFGREEILDAVAFEQLKRW